MKIRSLTYIIIIIAVNWFFPAQSQDVHFSQINRSPLYLNPAFTGDIENCFLRLGANYKSQWDKTYVTQSAYADARISPGKFSSNTKFGIGGFFYSDVAGDGNLKNNYGILNIAVHKSFNADQTLWGSLGFSFGTGNLSIDYSNFYFDSQWNGFMFDKELSDNEIFISSSFSYFDINVGGIVQYMNKKNTFKIKTGISLFHILEPKYSFADENIKLGRRYLAHTEVYLYSKKFTFKPSMFVSFQNRAIESIVGINVNYRFQDIVLVYGLWARILKDVIPVAGFEYKKLSVLFSYDINISEQTAATNYQGGLEFSLIKKICYNSRQMHNRRAGPCEY